MASHDEQARNQAFTHFVRTERAVLRRSAFRLCGDWHEADDLTQTALIAVLRNWTNLHRPQAAGAYARRVLVTAFIDEHRHARWTHEENYNQPPDREAIPAGDDLVNDRLLLWQLLQALGPRQRATVVLRLWEDLSVEQAAELLNVSPATVTSQLSRALATMRRLLQSLH